MQTTNEVQFGDGTTTSTSSYYTLKSPSYNAEKGWECPRCGRINAPWVRQCDCSARKYTITCDDNTMNDEWWKQYVTNTSDTFKIHPNEIVYTTAHNHIVGGSDYWDNTENIWSNILKNVSNIKEIY